MQIKIISYGYKFYEAEEKSPPYHDFLFSLRDLPNPFWVEELKNFNGLEQPIIEFFKNNPLVEERLHKVAELCLDFVTDFANNPNRRNSELVIAFRCTGGKHRSVYFAQSVFAWLQDRMQRTEFSTSLQFELEHIDLPKYVGEVV